VTAQTFCIPWEPTPKGRPRVTTAGGFARAYTPAKTRHAEAAMKYLLRAMGAVAFDRGIPLLVEIVFEVARPSSAPKRVLHPCKRPDIDNLTKSVLDAADGVLWFEDAQVVALHAVKRFATAGPCIHLTVGEFTEAPG
jgi:Holliday junction resolvase RusA-like endonuclease